MVEVRKATEVDVPLLEDVDTESDHFEWKESIHINATNDGRVFLALIEESPVGYLRYGDFLWDEREPFIQMVRVSENFRRQGIATQLIETFIKEAESKARAEDWRGVYSSVDVANQPSIALHEKLGFVACGEPQKLLGQKEPEIIFARPFAHP